MARIIFDPVTIADLLDHFQIEHGALTEPLRLDQLALRFQFLVPPLQLVFDAPHGLLARGSIHDVVSFRIDWQPQIGLPHLPEHRIDLAQRFDLVAPQFDPVGIVVVGREELDDVAANAECAAPEIVIVSFVENLDQPSERSPCG